MVASDLHGSLHYGKMLIDRFIEERADEMILLGDLYYHGPRNPLAEGYDPLGLAELLNAYKDKLIVIKGNCDSEVDEMVSEFKFLDTLTVNYEGIKLTLSHGHRYDIGFFPPDTGEVFLYGHTHQGFLTEKEGVIVGNPGSITLPKGGTPRSYITIDEKTVALKDLESGKVIDQRPLNLSGR